MVAAIGLAILGAVLTLLGSGLMVWVLWVTRIDRGE